MNILVTGASGFLGKHLVLFLQKESHNVLALNSKMANLCKQNSLAEIRHLKYDKIYHLAAWTQAGDFCLHHSGEQWLINQQINTNVLDWWQKFQPQAKLIALGTSVSYATEQDLVETKYLDGIPSDKFNAYAMSKRMLLAGLQALHKQFGLNYLYLIPSTLYGPGYHTDGRQMHFIYDLIRKILLGKLYGIEVKLWGDGLQRRELVYVDDFIKIMDALDSKYVNDYFNIGAGEDYSIKDFAKIICDIVDYDPSYIKYDLNGYVGAKSKFFNISKIESHLSDIPKTNIKKGIKQSIDWFLENKDILLKHD